MNYNSNGINLNSFYERIQRGIDPVTEFLSLKIRQFQFGKLKQAELLNNFAKLMEVGRLPYDISDHIAMYGGKYEAIIAGNIKANLQNGILVSDAFVGWINPMSIAALRAAEEGGQEGFCRALGYVSEELKRESDNSAAIYTKILSPLMYVIISFVFVIGVKMEFVPILYEINNGVLPPNAAKLDSYATFIINWGWLAILFFLAIIIAFKYLEKTMTGELRDKLEIIKLGTWYPFGGYRLKVGAHIVASFALLKRFNFPAFAIYKILANQGSEYQRYHIRIMEGQLPEGNENEIESLDSGLLEPQYISLLKLYTGVESSNIAAVLNAAAADIRKRCIERTQVNGQILFVSLWLILIYNLSCVVSVLMSTNR